MSSSPTGARSSSCAPRRATSSAWRPGATSSGSRLYAGGTPAQALERATAGVLRRPPQPPPMAFAPWNDAIFGPDEVRKIAALLRDNAIPSSAIWTEDFRGGSWEMTGYRLREEWDLDPTLYPDATTLASELHSQGFAWHAYFNSFINQDTRVYAEALKDGHLVKKASGSGSEPYLFQGILFKPSGLADLSRPATREWIKGYLRKALDVGFDGWMTDFGEWLPYDAVLDSGEDPLAAHNRYSAEWSRLSHEVLEERKADGRQRVFFARSGWLGSTEFTPIYWAGDQRTDFQKDDGLPTVVPICLGLGLAGVSTCAHDIGGYQSGTNPPATKELFFRWTTLGALSPVMRTHHGTDPKNQWWFGQDAETLAHYKRWAQLHIRLFPYLDGGASIAEATGLPLMRALPLAFPEDGDGWDEMEEYLLGPALLVAPVVEQGASSRLVHFPPGKWLPLSGGPAISGPADQSVDAPMTEIPVFARAGSLVPMLVEGVQTLLPAQPPIVDLAAVEGRRVLLVFAGAEGSFTERDGTSYRLELTTSFADGFREAGSALPACTRADQRGCIEPATAEGTLVRFTGQGPLEFDAYRLTVTGTSRTIDAIVRK
ncbi:MAG: glycoside hydrolase family 31 protein [Myxococcales bacterium]